MSAGSGQVSMASVGRRAVAGGWIGVRGDAVTGRAALRPGLAPWLRPDRRVGVLLMAGRGHQC